MAKYTRSKLMDMIHMTDGFHYDSMNKSTEFADGKLYIQLKKDEYEEVNKMTSGVFSKEILEVLNCIDSKLRVWADPKFTVKPPKNAKRLMVKGC